MSELSLYLLAYILLLAFGWIILRYLVPRDYQKHNKLPPLATFLQALLWFVYGGFPYLYLSKDWPAVSVPPVLHVAGVVLILSGLAFLFYGMFRLGGMQSLGRGGPGLQQTGIYNRSRNPQAIACGLYVVGFLVLWPSWYAVGWAGLYLVLIHWMVAAEEAYLARLHGQAYREYCERAPRYFGIR